MFLIRTACVILGEEKVPNGYWGVYSSHGSCRIVNVYGQYISDGGFIITRFKEGYAFTEAGAAGLLYKIDKYGNKNSITYCGDYFGEPSCGLICVNYVFYDIKTNEPKIDLTEYDIVSESYTLSFDENGELYFVFRNPAGHQYHVTIDTNGDFLYEPERLE